MGSDISRRYSRLVEEKSELPDLIIIDGGKGQLSSAVKIIKELGILEKVTIIGLAKKLEEVFFPGESEPVILPRTSSALKLLQQVRDEAHRFALTFHRKVRAKRMTVSALEEVPGVGPRRRRMLLRTFGSLEGIRRASVEDLAAVPTMTRTLAHQIHDFFQDEAQA